MAIIVSTNAYISVNGVDYSDHTQMVAVHDGQDTKEVTAMGDTTKRFRAGLGNGSVEATFYNDMTSSSVVQGLYALISVASTGFPVLVRKVNTARGPTNPEFTLTAIIDGDVNLLDEKVNEVGMLKVKFMPYSSFSVNTTTSS